MNQLSYSQRIEFFHLAFLEALAKRLDPSRYILKGGANLRYFFPSARYSEDIHIDLPRPPERRYWRWSLVARPRPATSSTSTFCSAAVRCLSGSSIRGSWPRLPSAYSSCPSTPIAITSSPFSSPTCSSSTTGSRLGNG